MKRVEFVHGVLPMPAAAGRSSTHSWTRYCIAFIACYLVATACGVAASSASDAEPEVIPIPVHHWSRYFTAPSYTRLPLIRGAVATLGEAASDLDTVLRVVNRRTEVQPRSLFTSPFASASSSSGKSQSTQAVALPVRKRIRSRPSHPARRTDSTFTRHRLHSMASNVANGSPLVGCASLDFSIPVMLGKSGSTVFQLLFDTGSSTLAVADSTCATCSSSGVSPKYAGSGKTGGTASSSYGDGSGWSGNVYTDTVTVAGTKSSTGITPAVSMKLASITQQTNNFFSSGTCSNPNSASSPWQGIIGFAYQSLAVDNTDSFPYKLIQQTTGTSAPYANEFYVEMCINDGALWFSGMSLSSYSGQFNYVPISVQTYYQVVVSSVSIGSSVVGSNLGSSQSIVDSGTSLWSMPTSTYNAAIAKINKNTQFASWFGSKFWSASTCATTPSGQTIASMNAALPTLSVTFGNGVVATLPAIGSYLIPCDATLTSWQAGIGDSGDSSQTMGWSFMNVFVVHHDVANSRIGFAVATGCSPMYTSTGSGALVSGNPSGPTGTGVGGSSSRSGSSTAAGGGSSNTGVASSSTAGRAASSSSTAGSAAGGGSTTGGSSSTSSGSSHGSTSSAPSSASSSGSSATGSDDPSSSTSSTGSASGSGSTDVVPTTFPFICTNLHFTTLPDANAQYDIMAKIGSDIASAAGVASSRVLVTSVQNLDSSSSTVTQVRFTFADALVTSQPTTTDVATRFINALSKSENPFTDKNSYPYLQYATIGGTHICSTQTELTSLPVVQFTMSYSIDSLPGGSVVAFADQIRSSLASACSTQPSRIIVNSVVAGSVLVSFVVSDSRTNASDISSSQAVNNFVNRIASNDGSSDSSSSLLSQATANSASVSNVGAAIAAANANQLGNSGNTSSSNTTTIIIIAVAIAGGILVIMIVSYLLYACCCKSQPEKSGSMSHDSAKVKPGNHQHQRNAHSQQKIGFSGPVHPGSAQTYAANAQQGYLPGPPLSHSNVQVLVAPPVSVQMGVPTRGYAQQSYPTR